jgi:hypothetical protein
MSNDVFYSLYFELISEIEKIIYARFQIFLDIAKKNHKSNAKWVCITSNEINNSFEFYKNKIPDDSVRKQMTHFFIKGEFMGVKLQNFGYDPLETHFNRYISDMCKKFNCKLINYECIINEENIEMTTLIVKPIFTSTNSEVDELKKELEKMREAYNRLEIQVGLINQVMKRIIPNYEHDYMTKFN